MLDAGDLLGILVMDEFSDIWTQPKVPFDYSTAFPEWWERDIEAVVAKDPVGEVRSVRASFGIAFPTDTGSRWSAELHGSTLLDQGIYHVTSATMRSARPKRFMPSGR